VDDHGDQRLEPAGRDRSALAGVVTPPSGWTPAAEVRRTGDPAIAVNRRASILRGLHRPGHPLLLPNAWDCSSARAVVAAGLPAVATSSAAVAETLGYRDGEATPVSEMLDAVARIVGAVDVPVTADLERGYRMAPGELVERLAATGAAGCNLEDSDPRTGAPVEADEQATYLADVRAAADRCDIDLVVNARIDTYLGPASDPDMRLTEAVRRARLYREAGADCVYPIGLADETTIGEFVASVAVPVNILAGGRAPTPAVLAGLGVARISFGPHLYRASRTHLAGLVNDILNGCHP
jgi:2-methylisocitrate lyase-like PEP mutase family enzyme